MNILDLRTVLASYVISNTICALVIYSLWIQNRRRAPGLSFWLIDYLLQFVVLVLLVSRGTLPDFISITLPVPLILTGTLLLYIGLEQYVGRTSSQVHNYFFLALIVAIHLYFTFALPSLQARNLNYSVGLFVICVQVAWLMLRQVDAQVQPATRVVGITFAFYCLVSIIRFIIDWSVPSGNDLFQSGLYDTLAILTYQMLFIGLTFALFLMVNRRLFTALQHDITQRERAENALLESNAKLELLFETLPVGISILDREHHIVKQNQALVGILGMTAEGWARDDYRNRQYLRPDGSPMPPEEFASSRVLRGESAALNVETGVIKEDGAVVWTNVSAVASPLADWNTLIVTSDITARKRAEEALRESEALFKSFFEHAVEAMFLTLPDSHIVAANPAACQLFGWTEQELIAGGRAIVVDATDPRLPILLKERLEKGTAHGELTHRRRDGTTFQGEITSTIYRDRDGKQRTSMIVRDITEHKRAEMQVAQMNRLYATLSQVNQTIVRVKDRNDLFQSICDVAVQHGGFALAWVGLVDESTGNVNPVAANGLDVARWPFEIPTIHQEEPQSLVAWAIRTSTVVISEDMQTDQRIRAYHEPTRRFDHHSAAMVPFRLRGQIIGVLALISREIDSFRATQGVGLLEEMGLDISFALDTLENEAERQRAEQAVLESNTRFRTLFESSPDAIMLIDLHDNWHILDCNTTACQMNGYARDELIGQSIDLLNLQPTSPAERADYIERIQKNQILRLESFHRRKNGTTFPVEISTSIINLGEREILMGIDRDVSERKQAEEEHQHRIEQMTILNVAAIKLQQHHDPQEIIQVACDELQRLGTFASIYTVTADGNHLEHTYTAMTEKMLREYTSAFGKLQLNFSVPITLYGPAWERLEMGEAIFDTEIASQVVGWMTDEQRSIADWTLTHSNKSAMILAPLARDHAIIGLITILGDPWGASDLSGITLFARHVSVALENARLFNETRQRLQELEAINKISTALRRAKTIEEMLPILYKKRLPYSTLPLAPFGSTTRRMMRWLKSANSTFHIYPIP